MQAAAVAVANAHPYSLLTTEEAAAFLKQSPRTLEDWRADSFGPKWIKNGRAVRYRLCDLVAWIDERVTDSTSG